MAHDPEIIGDDIAVGRDLQVALMHVGVEIPVAQRVLQEQLQHPLGQRDAVVPGRIQRGVVAQRHAIGPAQRHHPAAR